VPIWKSISPECKDLIAKMLVPADKRLTAQQVLDHPWFAKFCDKSAVVELPKLVTDNLKTFKGAQKVKKAILTYLATQLSDKEIGPMKKLFSALDKNGDGRLSSEEIKTGLAGKSNEKELTEIILSMDTDASGFIDYNEFLAAAIGEDVYLNKDRLQQAFNVFDKDKSGKIDAKELKEIIGSELKGIDETIWAQMIKDADANGDGQIDFEEFFKMMYSLKH
jgi:calcium-dependent protein kinase